MELKPVEIKSFLEWRQEHLAKKKKEQKNVSRSNETGGSVGFENVERQNSGHHSEIPIQGLSFQSSTQL